MSDPTIKIKRPKSRPAGDSDRARARRYGPKDKPWEMDLPVEPLNEDRLEFTVKCIRKGGSPGVLTVKVLATSAAEAVELIETGQVPGVGLGWQPLRDSVVGPD